MAISSTYLLEVPNMYKASVIKRFKRIFTLNYGFLCYSISILGSWNSHFSSHPRSQMTHGQAAGHVWLCQVHQGHVAQQSQRATPVVTVGATGDGSCADDLILAMEVVAEDCPNEWFQKSGSFSSKPWFVGCLILAWDSRGLYLRISRYNVYYPKFDGLSR